MRSFRQLALLSISTVFLSGCMATGLSPNGGPLELTNPDAEIWLRHDDEKLDFGYIVGGREQRPERSLRRIEPHGRSCLEFSESGKREGEIYILEKGKGGYRFSRRDSAIFEPVHFDCPGTQ